MSAHVLTVELAVKKALEGKKKKHHLLTAWLQLTYEMPHCNHTKAMRDASSSRVSTEA